MIKECSSLINYRYFVLAFYPQFIMEYH